MESQLSRVAESSSAQVEQSHSGTSRPTLIEAPLRLSMLTTSVETPEFLPVMLDKDLNAQCDGCFESLRKVAELAAQVEHGFTQTNLNPLQNIIHERRLRLAIWISDCGIENGSLSAVSENDSLLSSALASLFARMHADSKSIVENLLDLETKAKQAMKSVDDRPLKNRILQIEKNIESGCDDLTQCLYELTKLQSSIRMALAIHDKGPEAALYNNIKKVRETLLEDDNGSATTDDSASHTSSDEKCSECQLWFPAYALPLHEEGCKGVPKPQRSSTEVTGGESKGKIFAKTTKDDLQVPAEPSAKATTEAQTRPIELEQTSQTTAEAQTRPLVLLGDGSWCGREADTRSNIYLLARMIGIDIQNTKDTDVHVIDGKAWYIHGVSLGSTFIDYVFNGITAQDIAMQCIAAYKFIVDHYSYPDHQIWMFGLSRGAFMVRSVAGMINNCGIVKRVMNSDGTVNDAETNLLCHQVYRIYRSNEPINDPHSPQSSKFRQKASWPLIGDEEPGATKLLPPVKFLGLLDTVGSLGIPDFGGGVGLDWPQFYDQKVSSVVELVYHAVSVHDNLYIFPPCLAKRNPHPGRPKDFGITQWWFPGVHYDLGRQRFRFLRPFGAGRLGRRRFRFLRPFGGGRLERLLARWNWASKVIEPNEVVSDLVLKWILEAVKANDPSGLVISTSKVEGEIMAANERMVSQNRQLGDGDVYQNIVAYAPFGTAILELLTTLYGTRWQTNQIYQLFFGLRDRLVADLDSRVYNYMAVDGSLPNSEGQAIQELAGINRSRYPSQTYQAWRLCRTFLSTERVASQLAGSD